MRGRFIEAAAVSAGLILGAGCANETTSPQPSAEAVSTTLPAIPGEATLPTMPPVESTPSQSTTPESTSTTLAPPLDVHNPDCVYLIQPGDSLSLIANNLESAEATVSGLVQENRLASPDSIFAFDLLDICVDGVNDITGEQRVPETTTTTSTVAETVPETSATNTTLPPETTAAPAPEVPQTGVEAQQAKLSSLLSPYGMPELVIDGDSGSLTEQQLCAARAILNLPISRADMEPGGAEEQALMAADDVQIPSSAPVHAARWALIDKTCQVGFFGEGPNKVVKIVPVSTGGAGYETRDNNSVAVFRFDPALENNGWHDSTHYPVPVDNPLNGNMYRPLYFDGGQAIHGANYVPSFPASKGCVRLQIEDQDFLVGWLGLAQLTGPTWDKDLINLTVTTQGSY